MKTTILKYDLQFVFLYSVYKNGQEKLNKLEYHYLLDEWYIVC